MVAYNQVVNGMSKYIDQEIVSKMQGWQKWALGAGAGIMMTRGANTFNALKNHPIVKMLELYKYIDGKLEGVNGALAGQAVWNATQTANIGCMQNQIAQLFGLTKLVVPNASVCPGWGNVTVTPSTTTTGA